MTKDKIMYTEELFEEGVVKEAHDGIAEIVISDSEHCQECSAKIYCKPGSAEERSLTVRDPYGVHPGDNVRVVIRGSKILSAAFRLYGIPLILLLAGIFFGMEIFKSDKELFSSLLAVGLVAVYSVFLFLLSKKKKTRSYPKIIFVGKSR
ncbi:MAG: SoxR reducing system RseC family protein [Ignavibacteriaceae bacterium]|nr:SoxR reducing system RseC family protein [Ignavibacteriaceae bacterium]